MLNTVLLVAVAVLASDAAPVASTASYFNDVNIPMNHGKEYLISDLQDRAVCKFDVETEIDADSQIKYENVKCIYEAFGDREQLETSITLANGSSLIIKSGCVSVKKTVSSEPAQRKEIPPATI
jgi:imidazoleglycerol phosphate dehydratase HisB